MHEIFTMMLAVYDRAALMLICLFFLIRLRLFRELLHKSAHTPKELLAVTAIFSLFALFSTWSGVPVEGSLVNVRIIAVMSGGILFGPWVGAIVGAIAGVHRYLIDIDGVTAVPCFITSIVAGLLSGLINRKVAREQRWKIGILAGMMCETLTMILVVVWAPSLSLGVDIVSKIGIPMILGSVCIGFIVLLVQSVEGEKEASAARQAKLALDIANKTLPLFRHVNSDSLRQVCEIIRRDITADAVAITNTEHVLAYVGVGEANYQRHDDMISPTTRQAIRYGKIIIKNNDEAHRTPEIHSLMVIPLWEKGVVTGTLKIYYCHAHRITSTLQEMAIGLSQIISTQLEVSRAEQLREMANKAELRALQSKINPHFLFNALNAISSSIRLNPDTARQLIFNLSRYLRYNIELKDDEQIDIKRELYQIKDYIAIEQARFGDKLTVIYDIDDDVSCVIPSLLKGVVTGTLKIYYCHAHRITSTLQEMAIGLSQIISTQLEVSRAEQLREMANKAELRALQSKINPHFLFNALNAISSSIRLNPDTARQLIFNLSRYLRYNIELKDDEQIDIKRELYQIKDYIAIEQARFGDKLTVIYDIDDDVSCVIPSLLIQPLVENAIVHGIQPCKGKGVVTIGINECGNRVRISVRDTGNGIDPAVVARVEADEMPGNKIGLLNVHHRVKLLYGEGLHIRNLTPGTEIAFYVPNNSTPQALTESLLS